MPSCFDTTVGKQTTAEYRASLISWLMGAKGFGAHMFGPNKIICKRDHNVNRVQL